MNPFPKGIHGGGVRKEVQGREEVGPTIRSSGKALPRPLLVEGEPGAQVQTSSQQEARCCRESPRGAEPVLSWGLSRLQGLWGLVLAAIRSQHLYSHP